MTSNTDKMDKAWQKLKAKNNWLKDDDKRYYYHEHSIFKAGYQAREAESGWVLFKDIPDEWKDGRLVDLLELIGGEYMVDTGCRCLPTDDGRVWFGFEEGNFGPYRMERPTHARLPNFPPTPPKENN